jgi:hypothetical protein
MVGLSSIVSKQTMIKCSFCVFLISLQLYKNLYAVIEWTIRRNLAKIARYSYCSLPCLTYISHKRSLSSLRYPIKYLYNQYVAEVIDLGEIVACAMTHLAVCSVTLALLYFHYGPKKRRMFRYLLWVNLITSKLYGSGASKNSLCIDRNIQSQIQ